jgi:hypothetical protein
MNPMVLDIPQLCLGADAVGSPQPRQMMCALIFEPIKVAGSKSGQPYALSQTNYHAIEQLLSRSGGTMFITPRVM